MIGVFSSLFCSNWSLAASCRLHYELFLINDTLMKANINTICGQLVFAVSGTQSKGIWKVRTNSANIDIEMCWIKCCGHFNIFSLKYGFKLSLMNKPYMFGRNYGQL